jgi:hypothetical protein
MLIYVERLMKEGQMKLSGLNWRPVVYTAMLLSSKCWEDINSYNVDFSKAYKHYSLQAINKMESLFTDMIGWKLYISPELYSQYYFTLKDAGLPDVIQPPGSPLNTLRHKLVVKVLTKR